MKIPLYKMNLGDDVLAAIGEVTAQWSTLEWYVARITHTLCEGFKNPQSKYFGHTSFMQRRMALYEALCWPNIPHHVQEYGIGAISYIEQVENDRHQIIHGMACETEMRGPDTPPEKLIVVMREHPRLFFTETFTLPEIRLVAQKISRANGILFALYLHLFGVGPQLQSLDR